MIRPIDIRLNAAHPELPLAEAVTFTGAPSTVLIRGVPPNCGRWAITAVSVAATFPDGSTTTRAAVQSANGVWVATLHATATSGRTANGLRVLADGIDENGAAVTGYILGVADFAVASLGVTPAPEPGETSWQMLYFDAVPGTLRKGDVAKVDGVLKLYNGTAWEAFATPPALDDTVTSSSANGVKSSGIWSAIWGALAALPSGVTSLYDWVVAQLRLKRDLTDMACTVDVAGIPQIGSGKFVVTSPSGTYTTLTPFESGNVRGWGWYMTYPYIFARAADSYDIIFGLGISDIVPLDMTAKTQTVTYNGNTWTVDAFTGATMNTRLANMTDIPAASTATPAMDGTGAAGTSAAFARGDHVHPSDTSRVPTSRKVNGKALSSDVTLTGANIAVSGSDPTKISAALAGKASKADATLTERGPNHDGFSAWTVTPSTYDDGTYVYDLRIEWFNDGWCVVADDPISPGHIATFSASKGTAADTTIPWVKGVEAVEDFIATRTVLPGYRLGPDEESNPNRNKPLASEAEAEALRTGKQDALSAQQLANIAAVSDALAFDATHSYAAGDPVVYNGTLYTFTTTHTGAWTGSDVSAVDIIARLANVVHKTGSETIAGTKTFSNGSLNVSDSNGQLLIMSKGFLWSMTGGQEPEILLPTTSGTLALTAANPTAGNLAALDASGNPTDAGYHFEVRNGIPCIVQYT